MSISSFCQEGWHRPVLSLFAKVSLVFSCKLPKSACSQKFAFAQWSGAMKAPVGLLSDRTVLRSKMEGPCPDKFTLTRLDFCGNLSQQFNITYLFRVPARLPKEPEQVFNFLSLHNEPEPRPSQKGWSGSGCCVAIFYCQIQHRTLKIERPSAWDTRRRPRKGEPENAAGRGQESHAGRTAHPISTGQNGQLMW